MVAAVVAVAAAVVVVVVVMVAVAVVVAAARTARRMLKRRTSLQGTGPVHQLLFGTISSRKCYRALRQLRCSKVTPSQAADSL